MDIRLAESAEDLDEVRRLFRAFVVWHESRQGDDLALLASYFDDAAWEAEIAGLPGDYAPPGGALLLARLDAAAVGCVALHRIGDGRCEMKRMYVDDAGRGHGIGRALGEAILGEARERGYREMFLDTSVKQHEAIGLYRSLGFAEIEPYYDVPPEMRDWLVYFRLEL